MEQRQCPKTKQWFYPKRKNHIYLNRDIRIAHNNSLAKNIRRSKAKIQKTLDRDRKIIAMLLDGNREKIIPKLRMIKLGFDYSVMTDYNFENSVANIGVYEFAYCKYSDTETKIFKK